MKNLALGPFVALLPTDAKQKTFFESWKTLKIKPHWCYLSYNQTDKWIMKFIRITSKALSSEYMAIPDETSEELIIKLGNAVPKTLQVMLISCLYGEDFESCMLGLDENGQLHAYKRSNNRENILHSWSYNLNPNTPLITTLPPFYEKFGIRGADFDAISEAFHIKNRTIIFTKFQNYRDKLVTTLEKEMLDSLELIYAYEMKINTESFDRYQEKFSTLTEEDVDRLSRLYFSSNVSYFHMMVKSRSNRSAIDLLIKKITSHHELHDGKDGLNDARKELWALIEQSPIDVVYLQNSLINSDAWIDFVAEMPSKNVRLLCYYSNEAERLCDLLRFLLPITEKYPDKLQECIDQFTNLEFIHMAQAYADFYCNPPSKRRPSHFEKPTTYIARMFEHMTFYRMSQLTEDVQTISQKNPHWKDLHHFFEEAMQIIVAKLPHLVDGATNYQSL